MFCATDGSDLLQDDGQMRLKNTLVEVVIDKAGRITALSVAGSEKYLRQTCRSFSV